MTTRIFAIFCLNMTTMMMVFGRTMAFGVVRHNHYHHQQQQQQQLVRGIQIAARFAAGKTSTSSSSRMTTQSSLFFLSSSSSTTTTTTRLYMSTAAPPVTIKGIGFIQDAVLDAINELFDPAEVARGAALAKLNKDSNSKKKKKKKKGNDDDDNNDNDASAAAAAPELTEEEKMAIADAAAAEAKPFTIADTMVTAATRPEFGDYQINAAMGLSKSVGMNPRECATKIIEKLRPSIEDLMEEPEIAGPGFINLRFKKEYLASAAYKMAGDASGRLGIPETAKKQKIIVDYSSPNIAKEMHVGHLRSTIIGDTLCNLLEFSGHQVVRLNHVGDWGTQFGMLVEHLRDEFPEALSLGTSQNVDLGDLVELYKAAKKRFDVDADFKVRAREGVVKLQAGNSEEIAAWEALCAASRVEYQKIYDMLNIKGLEERGESFYNPYLEGVVQDLEKQGLAVESEGATAVFLEGYTNRDGTPLPMLIRKSDGGYNYATTDLAAIRHRVQLSTEEGGEKAERVLYVTDAGQSQHFEMVFAAAKLAGFIPENASLEHVPFGLVQGEDGKKFATRSGETVKLKDLLNESVLIAGEDLKSREENKGIPDDEIDKVARIIGVGAVKYADLSMNRESNYRFSYERMLSLNGNTAPYMLYAYARICGIIRKASGQGDSSSSSSSSSIVWPEASEIIISDDAEVELIRNLIKLPDILNEVERDLYPNRMCDYLFETTQKFNKFYEACSVNNAETPELKASRLSLCTATAGTIKLLLTLLGIETVERM